jgi:hypothetical protein
VLLAFIHICLFCQKKQRNRKKNRIFNNKVAEEMMEEIADFLLFFCPSVVNLSPIFLIQSPQKITFGLTEFTPTSKYPF